MNTNNKKNRRHFIKQLTKVSGSALASATALSACSKESNSEIVKSKKKEKVFNWKCVTVWPPNFPILGEGVNNLAEELRELSDGRLNIKVFGGGELVPALESFDAVQLGAAQMMHGAAYYWAGKIPASVFFTATPFGMTTRQQNAWLLYGGGNELWKELYNKIGLEPFPCGNTGVQMGGWFNKKLEIAEDLQGIKMRIPGLGGKVFSRAGGTAVTVAGGEIYTNLERGVLDATEWIGPYHDYLMGFHKIAKYYYYPGWHEPSATLELVCNKKAYDSLPEDLQEMIRIVSLKYNGSMMSEFEKFNTEYLEKIKSEGNNEILPFPKEVMETLKQNADSVMSDLISSDPFAKKVYESFTQFKQNIKQWSTISTDAIQEYL
ncbi:TRAP transporter substrate-binding protein DctP [Flammeovirga yaeyamensis]|uniref:TRAP transporter substrate-binding protein DctP n=1 Tax=Flammeovirga yaeyamensis TaxID=367791 RepID=A0AAX1N1Y0_9BACT|nr:TRAP transporter substrate-binding protein [Flammeovirga yaeyamensis]MBB3698074.1 TRAP-type mannitol/chloroaromatic compound transport system substrate-binding protein [Flammeovirga yaeyamensis]NMF34567.1 TRAP transporter substrate-binding protein [Flammeovirga yaeyamensis]QWG01544.1 TRAP transporter substrate-binding protein DctP [Flammeovirga yaeyamensis]